MFNFYIVRQKKPKETIRNIVIRQNDGLNGGKWLHAINSLDT